ncbi:MAG: AbrB/MazE/SpoVT family DNA-binding domain-containing protein, partial [Armatimonadetes bacterium]|nr:AbrB/MazE/SpoVT family DNA-binding domain-containing protein [Armatimonadota bacterium]
METRLDEHGNLPLPAELRSALGWKPGQALHLQVSGEHLLVQPAAPGANLKEEAR